jgi:long-chain acyl-CoA synthetase
MSAAHGSCEHWAELKPEQIAVIEGDRTLTYGAWNDAANRVANALASFGITAGDIVVARTHIRLEWAILSAALAKLGCSLLGLNWRLTPAEARHVLANSGAHALICDDADPAQLAPALAELPLKVCVSIEAPAPGFIAFDALLEADATPRFAAKDPPLIVYSSGTTGAPKGVVMGRRSPHYTEAQVAEYQRDVRHSRRSAAIEGGVTLVTMPMHHGSGPAQMWGARSGGRKIVLLRRFDPEAALALIDRHRVTDWGSVPTMLKRIAALPPDILRKYDVSSLKHLSVGAAPVPYSLKEWVLGYFGEGVLSEGYGSTETGMVTRLTPEMQRAKPGSSGTPYVHVAIDVRGPDGESLPRGQTGELWIRTPTTLGSYLNGAALGPDQLDPSGFFRVGDVGYLDDEGYLYITDRAKDLIISGGVNIYPAEIERALLGHPAILDVAVIGIPDDEFGEQVKAICELKCGHAASAAELMSFAAERLASYKRPKSIEFVAELPRNSMGKVLKRELRAPYWAGRERNV